MNHPIKRPVGILDAPCLDIARNAQKPTQKTNGYFGCPMCGYCKIPQ